jgi:Raf kinase inhibitor-like YbhB/YbcL family protein
VVMELRCNAFMPGSHIPDRYTCEGANVSPPLTWHGVPSEAKSLVLIVDDPDALNGVFTHWVLYDIPFGTSLLPEGKSQTERSPWNGTIGRNDFGSSDYEGPCTPRGTHHHYHFRLYALNTWLGLPPGATRAQVLGAMQGHVIANTELIGTHAHA